MSLTKPQMDLLRELAQSGDWCHFYGSSRVGVANRLSDRGLIERNGTQWTATRIRITNAGRAAVDHAVCDDKLAKPRMGMNEPWASACRSDASFQVTDRRTGTVAYRCYTHSWLRNLDPERYEIVGNPHG